MNRLLPVALVLAGVTLLAPTPRPQDPPAAVARQRLILTLAGSRPDLSALRAAIRDRDPVAADAAAAALDQEARARRADLERTLENLGVRIVEHFWLIDACVVDAPDGTAARLAELPGVVRTWENEHRAPGGLAAPIRTSTDTDNHGTDTVHARGVRGSGVTVAVVDSGLDETMATQTRPHRTFFVNGDPNNQTGGGIGGSRLLANVQVGAYPADDPIDHGTRVAGVAAGARWNATAVADDGHAPRAGIVGYGMVDLMPSGFAAVATMVRTWQRCALDAATYGTSVAVISYSGANDPTAPDQQAMDACAEVADIVVAAMAGNDATSPVFYQAATNVLAVGAVSHDTHLAASFTARGPLRSPGVAPRVYPHLVANGEAVEMPTANLEASFVVRSGTSYSAPQVAGAAALFRSLATQASAEETRAAILATVDDERGPNQADLDALGHGYLRVDRLCDLAEQRIPGTFARGRVDTNAPVWTTTFAVTGGEVYAAALAFSRRDVTTTAWANLDLRVSQGGALLAESAAVADSHERVVFRAAATGMVTLEVRAVTFEIGTVDQEFGVAAARAPLPLVTEYGTACAGSRSTSQVREVEPPLTGRFGNASSDRLIGGTPHRTQQWIDTLSPSAAFYVRGLALRHDDAAGGVWNRGWVELDVTFALTMDPPTTATTTFAQNLGRLPTQVIQRKRFVLPPQAAPNQAAANFGLVLPLDQSFSRQYDPVGPNPGGFHDLIVDVRTWATSAGAGALTYPLDAVTGLAGGATTLFAATPTATTGTLLPGEATVIGLVDALGAPRMPTLGVSGVPTLGDRYELRIDGAVPSAQVFFGSGASRTAIGGLPLPLDLAVAGAPGCFVLNDLALVVPIATSPTGSATFALTVPNAPALRGRELFHQGLVFDDGANQLGLVTTRGIGVVVGH